MERMNRTERGGIQERWRGRGKIEFKSLQKTKMEGGSEGQVERMKTLRKEGYRRRGMK